MPGEMPMQAKHNERPANLRITRRFIECLVAAAAGAILVAVFTRGLFRPAEEDATREMQSLWQDDYQRLAEGSPPWPRGVSAAQSSVLERAETVVVATIDPCGGAPGTGFHRFQVLGARAYRAPDQVSEIVNRLVGAIRDDMGPLQEFYPAYAARIIARSEQGATEAVDLLIAPYYRCMYVLSPSEQRYCVIDERTGQLMRELADGLPRKYEYE